MSCFLKSEKPKQTQFKQQSRYFSDPARLDGIYKNKSYPFCLPREHAEENLYAGICEHALDLFGRHGIHWHDGQKGKPSNHLCSSQVCCVNFLYPFADQPAALAQILRPIYPELERMLPVEDGQYVSFEWIGQKNYLGERTSSGSQRTRGANSTSADAVVMFERKDRLRQTVLIEWKYTESYGGTSLKLASSGTDRTIIYRRLFEQPDCPIKQELLPDFDDLFYEPFYQLMRQQFLAHEMEKAHEAGADIVSVLHIAPAHNLCFRKITSPALVSLGQTATEVWKRLVRTEGRFISVFVEQVFGSLSGEQMPEMKPWLEYITTRYRWVVEAIP